MRPTDTRDIKVDCEQAGAVLGGELPCVSAMGLGAGG